MNDFRYIHLNSNNAIKDTKKGTYTFNFNLPDCEWIGLKSMNLSNTGQNIFLTQQANTQHTRATMLNVGSTNSNVSHTLQWVEMVVDSYQGNDYNIAYYYSYSPSITGHYTALELVTILNNEINSTTDTNYILEKTADGTNKTQGSTTTWNFTISSTIPHLVSLTLSKPSAAKQRVIYPIDSTNSLWTSLGYSKTQLYNNIDEWKLVHDFTQNFGAIIEDLYIDVAEEPRQIDLSGTTSQFVAETSPVIENSSGFYIISNKLCGEDSYMNQIEGNQNQLKKEAILKWIPNNQARYHHIEYESNFLEMHKINKLTYFDIEIRNDNFTLLSDNVIPSFKITLVCKMANHNNGGYSANDMKLLNEMSYKKAMCPC